MENKSFINSTKGKIAIIGGVAVAAVAIILAVLLKDNGYRSILVENVKGSVSVVGEKNNGEAYAGQRLYSGDDVTVNAQSELTMCVDNDKYVYADENTHFRLEASSKKESSKIKIIMDKGSELNVLNAKLGLDDTYEVDTPNSTMSVRGTTFRMTVYNGNDGYVYTLLEVEKGEVLAKLKLTGGTYTGVERAFTAGESALIKGNAETCEFLLTEKSEEVWLLDYDHLPTANVPRLITLLRKNGIKIEDPAYDEYLENDSVDADNKAADKDKDDTTAKNDESSDKQDEAKPTEHVHVPGEFKTVKEATCTAAGLKQKVCKECGEVLEEEKIAAKGHTPGEWETVKATCETPGSKQQKCSVCNEVLNTEVIPATGHIPGDWVTTSDSTCEAQGTRERRCTVCGKTLEIDSIQATGHSFSSATCTEASVCSNCGATNGGPLGHDWQLVPNASYKQEQCSRCGAIR
ncbi:MAG: FecR domain-containing protein [Lachnospiraceae bacterium]|nr:FecR domain-containing protein [Lachnospiraceae bacterium]